MGVHTWQLAVSGKEPLDFRQEELRAFVHLSLIHTVYKDFQTGHTEQHSLENKTATASEYLPSSLLKAEPSDQGRCKLVKRSIRNE